MMIRKARIAAELGLISATRQRIEQKQPGRNWAAEPQNLLIRRVENGTGVQRDKRPSPRFARIR